MGEALACAYPLEAVFATSAALERETVLTAVPGELLYRISDASAARLSDLSRPGGIVAVAERRLTEVTELTARPGPLLLLAGLNDPGNVGTLLRSAEAFGIGGAVLLAGGADPYQPKIVRAAMGSLFRLPLALAAPEDIDGLIRTRPVIIAARGGTPLPEFRFPADAVIAIGHERHGFGPQFSTAIAVEIPHEGPTESLNAAMAGSIVLYAHSCQKTLSRPWPPEG